MNTFWKGIAITRCLFYLEKNRLLLVVLGSLFFFCSTGLMAQDTGQFDLKGTVVDSTGNELVSATVVLMNASDSVLVGFTMTNNQGQFELKNQPGGDFLLQFSYLGYATKYQSVTLQDQATVDVGTIKMDEEQQLLEQVEVKAERIPLRIKKDTLEFDAGAFQVQPTDVVEDLLKKLPGVEVDRDGTIRAQGEAVEKVMVDGKEFFGDDPQIASKNLPADAVDKVQIYNKKSDQAEFSGIDDGQREKTINLELKEDKKKGYFGNTNLGGGTDGRYSGKASINRFSPKQQMSLIGMANNTNEQGFSINDYLNFMGGLQAMMGGGGAIRLELDSDDMGLPMSAFGGNNGFTTTWAGGLNFNNQLGKKTELNGSYFFNRMDNDLDRTLKRENFLADQTFTTLQNSLQESLNNNHRFNFTLDHKLDDKQSLKLRSSFTYNDSNLESFSNMQNLSDGSLENTSEQFNASNGQNIGVNSNLLYRRKFNKKGRTFSTNFNFALRDDDREGNLETLNDFYEKSGNLLRRDTISQDNQQENSQNGYGVRLSYTEPLGKRKYLEANYLYQKNTDKVDRKVYDRLGPSDAEREFNETLSNRYNSGYTYNRGGLNFRWNTKKSNFTSGVSLQHSNLDGDLFSSGVDINKSFTNVLPSLRWSYEFSMSQRLSLDYDTEVGAPTITQLQPVVDNSNPFDLYVGNPDLRPAYNHNVMFRFMSFSQATLTNFFMNFNLRYTTDRISNAQETDEFLVRTTQPINVDDDLMIRSMVSFGTPLRFMKARVNLDVNTFYNRGINFINAVENQTKQLVTSGNLSLENRFKEKFDLIIGADLSYNQTKYSIMEDLNQDYINQTYYIDLTLNLPKGFNVETSLDYTIYSGLADGFNEEIPIWKAAVSKYVLKDKRGQIRLSAVDLLNQNTGINRRAELNYVIDERIRSLGRYVMLSFHYSLKGFGGVDGPGGIRVETRGRR